MSSPLVFHANIRCALSSGKPDVQMPPREVAIRTIVQTKCALRLAPLHRGVGHCPRQPQQCHRLLMRQRDQRGSAQSHGLCAYIFHDIFAAITYGSFFHWGAPQKHEAWPDPHGLWGVYLQHGKYTAPGSLKCKFARRLSSTRLRWESTRFSAHTPWNLNFSRACATATPTGSP